MNLTDSIKRFFKAKENREPVGEAPEGVCPNCWGRQDWEGNYYKKIKAKNITPESNTYTSFIHEIATKLDKITLKEDTYECLTCETNFKNEE